MRWLPEARQGDIWFLDCARADAPQPLFESRFVEAYPCPSPDGRYLAYQSDRTDQNEIYVTKVPEADRHVQVSFSGGQYPQWVENEIFFVTPRSNELMTAKVSTKPVFRSNLPQRLFYADSAGVQIQGWSRSKFTVSDDGQRVLASRSAFADQKPSLVVVENWFEEFRRRSESR